ncbi:MAG: phage holin family protein [Dehalococcoidia bacterium]
MRRDNGPELFGINLRNALSRLAINTIAILVASKVISGIRLSDWQGAVLAGAIFGLVNAFIKPVVKTLTCPLYLLTLGIFALVVNALMLALTSWIAQLAGAGFSVDGFTADILGALAIGFVAWLASLVIG